MIMVDNSYLTRALDISHSSFDFFFITRPCIGFVLSKYIPEHMLLLQFLLWYHGMYVIVEHRQAVQNTQSDHAWLSYIMKKLLTWWKPQQLWKCSGNRWKYMWRYYKTTIKIKLHMVNKKIPIKKGSAKTTLSLIIHSSISF